MRNRIIFLFLFVLLLTSCDNNPYGKGMKIYQDHCAVCHAADGTGLQGLIPPIRQADYLIQNQKDLACIIRQGLDTAITVNNTVYDMQVMPPNDLLNDIAITNLINFINNAWGNKGEFVTVEKVTADLKRCE